MGEPLHSTAEALLDAAEELFSARGYAAVGIREIVERAGANIAAINYHFGSKRDLYLAAVRRAMQRRRTAAAWQVLEPAPEDPMDAAVALIRFVRRFLHGLLPVRDDEHAFALLLREAIQPTGAIEAVVRDFVEPNERLLAEIVAVLVPKASADERALLAQAVLGQIVHYRVFLPYLERLSFGPLEDPERVATIADHVARFSLLGLGWAARRVEAAMERAGSHELLESPGR
ncbi:MAG: TetR/AcrR family transcriptional regulator [Planctomycetota bacterium]